MKTYKFRKFSVDVESDGAISVNPGDSLSKYSAAIHNDFIHVYEFGRKNSDGTVQAVTDINKIYANETLYHIPTVTQKPAVSIVKFTNEEKKKIVLDALKADFNLNGEHLKLLTTIMGKVGYVNDALSMAEIAGFITEGSVVATAASTLSTAVLFASPFLGILGLMNAVQSNERVWGMRAVAYTITAWAYDEPILTSSKKILQRMSRAFPPEKIIRYNDAWQKASRATLNHLAAKAGSGKISKKSFQLLLMALGNNNKGQLCLEILKGFEGEIGHIEIKFWKANYSVLYPV